ncbi:MAG: multicopper oxidase domain-containing protein [Chloroflexota bacterium]
MQTKKHTLRNLSVALVTALLVLSLFGLNYRNVQAAGLAATLPASTACTLGAGTATCDLYATTGTLTMPDAAVIPVWGYADISGGVAQVPGPALIVNQGDAVTVTLHNDLAEATSLRFEGLGLVPDRTGAAPGGTAVYTFTASQAGTFLYEAGPVPGAEYQVSMGLYGALIVRPATPGQAFASVDSAYDDEALVVLSEIDPALNASPVGFDMRGFNPKYFLVNGKAYPDATAIETDAGRRVLLRYVNAGTNIHNMAILGVNQKLLSLAGAELPFYKTVNSQYLLPGQSADAIATIPAGAIAGTLYPFYDASFLLHNNGSDTFGGMMTFLAIPGTLSGADILGPAANSLALDINPATGAATVMLTATLSDVGRGDSAITSAEFCLDAAGTTCYPMTVADGTFDTATEAVYAELTSGFLGTLASASHTLFVRGTDALANVGTFNTITLVLDKTGPESKSIVFAPTSSNGTKDVILRATADDSALGGSNIVAAEFYINAPPASAMSVNVNEPVASLSATISAATIAGLGEGDHTVYVRAQDDLGNWGDYATGILKVDTTGPATSGMTTTPSGLQNGSAQVRVDATITDTNVKVATAELFVDTIGADGTGLAMMSLDGTFNQLSEAVYAFIPQSQINALSDGSHTVFVHGKDAAGNWGAFSSLALEVDKTRPAITGVDATPNPTNDTLSNNTSFTLSAMAGDPVPASSSDVVYAEWFRGADPGQGSGTAFSFAPGQTVSLSAVIDFVSLGWPAGNNTVYLRARDAAGNWSLTEFVIVDVVYPSVAFVNGFDEGNLSAWSEVGGAPNLVAATASKTQAGEYAMQARIASGKSGYVRDNSPTGEKSFNASFYFNPNNLRFSSKAAATKPRTLFVGKNASNGNVFMVQMRRTSQTGAFQVRALVWQSAGLKATAWTTIARNQFTQIGIEWTSARKAAFKFYINGTLKQSLTGLNTNSKRLETVFLGPQNALTGATGVVFFDSYESTRFK